MKTVHLNMAYRSMSLGITLGRKLKLNQDPISRYNLIIDQYNDSVNREDEIFLLKAYGDCMYRLCYLLESAGMILLLIIYFLPYISVLTLTGNIYSLIIHEIALERCRRNDRQVPDLFTNMIYSPILCKRGKASYLYFEIEDQKLESFDFPEEVIQTISKRKDPFDKMVRFMVYTNKFLSGYHNLWRARYIPILHIVLNIAIIVIMQYFVYGKVLCFSLLDPINSVKACL